MLNCVPKSAHMLDQLETRQEFLTTVYATYLSQVDRKQCVCMTNMGVSENRGP